MSSNLPGPGKTAWHGDKLYSTCDDCYKLVQINKRGIGGIHICISAYERAVRNREIASKEMVEERIQEWNSCEHLLRDLAKKMGMINSQRARISRITQKLGKRKYISIDAADSINTLAGLMKDLNKAYKKGYQYGDWITEDTSYSMESIIATLKGILNKVNVSKK